MGAIEMKLVPRAGDDGTQSMKIGEVFPGRTGPDYLRIFPLEEN